MSAAAYDNIILMGVFRTHCYAADMLYPPHLECPERHKELVDISAVGEFLRQLTNAKPTQVDKQRCAAITYIYIRDLINYIKIHFNTNLLSRLAWNYFVLDYILYRVFSSLLDLPIICMTNNVA